MTIDEIIKEAKAHGSHFFDDDTMRFFNSKISNKVYEGVGGIFFVTSEQFESSTGWRAPRMYSVRCANDWIDNVPNNRWGEDGRDSGAFNVLTRDQAHFLAKLMSETLNRKR